MIEEDDSVMIVNAVLFDLLGSKALASISFSKEKATDEFLQLVVESYYKLMQEDSAREFVTTEIEGKNTCICKVSEVTIIVGLSDSDLITEPDIERMKRLQEASSKEIQQTSVRDFKEEFETIADALLRERMRLCFITSVDPSFEDKTGTAVDSILKARGQKGRSYSTPILIGPFTVEVMRISSDNLVKADWSDDLTSTTLFVLVISPPLPTADRVEQIVMRIRERSSSQLIVVPGSDSQLELAREYEDLYGLELSDVSSKPTHLLLSSMAIAGFIDMHPELAYQRWEIDESIDGISAPEAPEETEVGHQAFFVVDRRTGEAAYSYYYDERSKLLEMAPNIVAAISAFKFDPAKPTETSVFRTGDLNYITIERGHYVYTLITGTGVDVEVLREKFSFLPDLFMDEIPEVVDDPTDLFRSPPFTLKLLATLPPNVIPTRMAPKQNRALLWERFENAPLRDFLEAVWNRLDGSLTMSLLVPSKGPEMVLGAIHLLHRMGAIQLVLKIGPDDVPVLLSKPNTEVLSLYSRADEIIKLVDGKRTIENIAKKLRIQPSVLITVFAELHRREIITIKEG
ncbi:MAG: hypothetical protein AM326_11255 [Candidatus Thorarchaeota archaeon SMTZ-45]|nr:MAG: hypothetical protein AM326_11255 [Candidatus Thorarchaeota archaeon SMTZ-45]